MSRSILGSTTIRNIIRGASTVLDIYPNTDYSRYLTRTSDAERLGGDWRSIGNDFWKAETGLVGKSSELLDRKIGHHVVSVPTQAKSKRQKFVIRHTPKSFKSLKRAIAAGVKIGYRVISVPMEEKSELQKLVIRNMPKSLKKPLETNGKIGYRLFFIATEEKSEQSKQGKICLPVRRKRSRLFDGRKDTRTGG